MKLYSFTVTGTNLNLLIVADDMLDARNKLDRYLHLWTDLPVFEKWYGRAVQDCCNGIFQLR